MPHYRIEVLPRAQRRDLIRARVTSTVPPPRERFFDLGDREEQLPRIRLPLGLPIYRMGNGRTSWHQEEYIHETQKPADFFSAGQENDEAQQAQHQILARLAEQGQGDTIFPVIDALLRDRQREALLITEDGIVVNGNRRLAAMRELAATGRMPFNEVECLVLPAVHDQQVADIEFRLQVRRETKLEYDWVNEARLIERQLRLGRTPTQVATEMRTTAAQVEIKRLALQIAEAYLRRWHGGRMTWLDVVEQKQLFEEMAKARRGQTDTEWELGQRFGFLLADRRGQLRRRAYEYKFAFGDRRGEVARRLQETLPAGPNPDADDTHTAALDDDVLQINLPLLDPARERAVQLATFLDEPGNREQAADALVTICEDIEEEDDQDERERAALRRILKAIDQLSGVDLSTAARETYEPLAGALDRLGRKVDDLRAGLDRLRNAGG